MPHLFLCCSLFLLCWGERRWKAPDLQTGCFPSRMFEKYILVVSCTGDTPVCERLGVVVPTVTGLQIKGTRASLKEHSWGKLLPFYFSFVIHTSPDANSVLHCPYIQLKDVTPPWTSKMFLCKSLTVSFVQKYSCWKSNVCKWYISFRHCFMRGKWNAFSSFELLIDR